MLNSDEICQTDMSIDTLTMFDYITHGTSKDIDIDFDMPNYKALDFD